MRYDTINQGVLYKVVTSGELINDKPLRIPSEDKLAPKFYITVLIR